MGSLDQTQENVLLDASLDASGASVRAATGPIHCRLMTANGSSTANGTELGSAGGYTAGTGAPTVTFSAATAGLKQSSSVVSVTNMPATTINGIELWDSAGTPARKWWGALSVPVTTNLGDTFTIAAGSISCGLG